MWMREEEGKKGRKKEEEDIARVAAVAGFFTNFDFNQKLLSFPSLSLFSLFFSFSLSFLRLSKKGIKWG